MFPMNEEEYYRQMNGGDRCATESEADQEWVRNVTAEDPEHCRCHGGGWICSSRDVWYRCSAHFNGQAHPEDHDYEEWVPLLGI